MTHHTTLAIDFDGCTDTPEARENLIKVIVNLITNLITNNPDVSTLTVMISSLRQSLSLDILNGQLNAHKHNGQEYSCSLLQDEFMPLLINGLKDIIDEDNIDFDPFLMSDVFGTHFDKMREYARNNEVDPFVKNMQDQTICIWPNKNSSSEKITAHKQFIDTSKISTLYAQLHYTAEQYDTNDTLTFVFIDDRIEILNRVKRAFTTFPQLIPRNFTLKLIAFNSDGECNADFATISGSGDINNEWQSDLLDLRIKFNPVQQIDLGKEEHIQFLLKQLIHKHRTTPVASRRPITPLTEYLISPRSFFKPIDPVGAEEPSQFDLSF